jgi:DNA-binding transcriptional LysR family regulator
LWNLKQTETASKGSIFMQRSADIHVQQLHTFRSVYQQGGYAAAARESNLSVPTVWQHCQSLEKLYRVRLFEKVGRRVRPTAAATQLHDAIDQLLVGLESTFDLVRNDEAKPDTIALVTGVRMMMEDLAEPLSVFRRRFPNRLLIRHGNNRRAEELIVSGEADLALTLEAGFQQESPQIHYEPAYFVDFLAVASKRHPFAVANTSSLRELVKHDLIVTTPGTHGRDALEQALHRERLSANIAVETDNSGFTIACVRTGMGLGILAGRLDGQLCRQLVTRSLRRQLGRRQIVFMWRKGRRLTDPALGLIEEVCRHHASAQGPNP